MNQEGVEQRLDIIHACQENGQVWMSQIIFAQLLDRLADAGMPSRVWVDFADHVEQGGLIVLGTKGRKPKCLSVRLLSGKFRRQIKSKRKWGKHLPRIRDHERLSPFEAADEELGLESTPELVAQEPPPDLASEPVPDLASEPVEVPDLSTVLKDLFNDDIEKIVRRADGYFCIHPPEFWWALAVFAKEDLRRKERKGDKK